METVPINLNVVQFDLRTPVRGIPGKERKGSLPNQSRTKSRRRPDLLLFCQRNAALYPSCAGFKG